MFESNETWKINYKKSDKTLIGMYKDPRHQEYQIQSSDPYILKKNPILEIDVRKVSKI